MPSQSYENSTATRPRSGLLGCSLQQDTTRSSDEGRTTCAHQSAGTRIRRGTLAERKRACRTSDAVGIGRTLVHATQHQIRGRKAYPWVLMSRMTSWHSSYQNFGDANLRLIMPPPSWESLRTVERNGMISKNHPRVQKSMISPHVFEQAHMVQTASPHASEAALDPLYQVLASFDLGTRVSSFIPLLRSHSLAQ